MRNNLPQPYWSHVLNRFPKDNNLLEAAAGYLEMRIKKNKEFVNFSSKADEAIYTADNPVTKVKRMIDVFKVWEDFLKGEFAGHGFIFWVIISILVDIAAFMFFDLAFKKEDY